MKSLQDERFSPAVYDKAITVSTNVVQSNSSIFIVSISVSPSRVCATYGVLRNCFAIKIILSLGVLHSDAMVVCNNWFILMVSLASLWKRMSLNVPAVEHIKHISVIMDIMYFIFLIFCWVYEGSVFY